MEFLEVEVNAGRTFIVPKVDSHVQSSRISFVFLAKIFVDDCAESKPWNNGSAKRRTVFPSDFEA